MSIPSAEAFKDGINITLSYLDHKNNDLFCKMYMGQFDRLAHGFVTNDFFVAYEQERKEILKCTIEEYKTVTDWLLNEPAFKLAYDDEFKYTQANREQEIKKIYKENNRSIEYFEQGIMDNPMNDYRFIYLLSELFRCCYLYLSNGYIEKATEAKRELQELKDLLTLLHDKVDKINALQWKPERIEVITLPGVDFNVENDKRRSIKELDSIIKSELGTTRNDTSIKERMFISDLIKLHLKLFNNPEKNRITKIMSLPFFDNTVEQRTIERLISKSLDN